ncbi:ABC transporter substrate-binding protein [Frankia sp. R82]|uniref:ABC transporter substrate-binding protein n=1 Tax=Frankia sp. R82 TaxID=2950553 RepID=UPI0020433780|nr:ABC transporter substrate-binding protein [Frankia sp. R82]MCM3886292.1 ABC transporter substrate-binding protein [Frankia sp. R82]
MSTLSALVLLAAGCSSSGSDDTSSASGSSTAPAVSAASLLGPADQATGAPVKIGLVSDGKGPASDTSIELSVADATTKYLNEHKGGVAGRPIQLVKCETQNDPAKGTDCGNRMVEEKVAAVVVGQSAVADAVWQPVHAAKVPFFVYAANTAALLTESTSTFSLGDPTAQVRAAVDLAKSNGLKKVTAIVVDVPPALGSFKADGPKIASEAGVQLTLLPVPLGTADMTPQLQKLSGGDSAAFVLGSEGFCIAAFNGLRTVGFTGPIGAIGICASDATRKAVTGGLKGMSIVGTVPIGADNPSTRLYDAVRTTYGKSIDPTSVTGLSMFMTLSGFQTAVAGLKGDVTPATVTSAIKSMPESELPGSGGQKFQCSGKILPNYPAVCLRGALTTKLDAKGNPTTYQVLGSS